MPRSRRLASLALLALAPVRRRLQGQGAALRGGAPRRRALRDGREGARGAHDPVRLQARQLLRAIEYFQAVIDNYPYSEHAVKAELKIADAYYDDGKYDEALSYYRDFARPAPAARDGALHRLPLRDVPLRAHRERAARPDRDAQRARHLRSPAGRVPALGVRAEGGAALARAAGAAGRAPGAHRGLLSRSREYEAAAERYRLLLDAHPGLGIDARVLYKLGGCYESLNRVDEADRISARSCPTTRTRSGPTARASASRRTS